MTSSIFITFIVVLPIAMLCQFVRSRHLPKPRHFGADLLESAGLALGMSLSVQGITIFPQWHSFISSIVLFMCSYFPLCFLADWIRKRSRHDA
jgi:hypothetical protein